MQRLIEQPAAEGDLLEEGVYLGRVHYHLAVYRHYPDDGGDPVAANLEVEGRLAALEDLDLDALHATGIELTLRLADGRWLDFRILDGKGSIRSTGRGLYRR
jgi:hypothetical protein